MDKLCRLCGSSKLNPLIDMGSHPIAHHYLASLDGPKPQTFPFVLCFCDSCGFFQVRDPIPPENFYSNYITLSSWKHQPHIPHLVELLRTVCELRVDAPILEVGSNDGIFLRALREAGFYNTLGIEPAKDAQESARRSGIETVGGYFNRKMAEELVASRGQVQLFVNRQVLEHIEDLSEFAQAIRTVLAPGGFALIEVPNFTCNLQMPDYSLWEEHINYFTLDTLNHFLRCAGIKPVYDEIVLFSGETLVTIGKSEEGIDSIHSVGNIPEARALATLYSKNWPLFRDAIVGYLRNHRDKGGKIAIYGAGARLSALVNFAGLAPFIEFVVDDQLEKQGKFMPGSELAIVPSSMLEQENIDLCLLAVNTESEEKAMAKHRDWIERGGQFYSVLPPSERLLPVWSQLGD